MGESRKFVESRKRRREMEEVDKTLRVVQDRVKAEAKAKEDEMAKQRNTEVIQRWNEQQARERENRL